MGWFSPKNPQTGDGKTSRDIYDTPKVTFRDAGGKKVRRGTDMTSKKAVKAAQDRAKKGR